MLMVTADDRETIVDKFTYRQNWYYLQLGHAWLHVAMSRGIIAVLMSRETEYFVFTAKYNLM
jgi:hypothetical protein